MSKENIYNIHHYKFLDHYYLVFVELPVIIAIDEPFYHFLKTNKITNAKDILKIDNVDKEYKLQISKFITKINKAQFRKRNEEYELYINNFYNNFNVQGIWLGLTHSCNMSCDYCFEQDSAMYNKAKMNLITAKKAIDFLAENSKEPTLKIIFFGGEPLLEYELIKKIVSYCRKFETKLNKKFSFTMTTNATLLDSQKMEYFSKEKIGIMISFDGNAEMNCYRRMSDKTESFSRVYKNVKELINKYDISIRATLSDKNDDYNKCHAFFKEELNCKNLLVSECSGNRFWNSKSKYKLKKRYINSITKASNLNEIPSNIRNEIMSISSGTKWNYNCGTGITWFYISPEGNIFPCNRVINTKQEIMFGNIKSGIDIGKVKEFINLTSVNNSARCKKCWAKHLCGGGCYGEKIEANQSYTKPYKLFCDFKKFKIKASSYFLEKFYNNGGDTN